MKIYEDSYAIICNLQWVQIFCFATSLISLMRLQPVGMPGDKVPFTFEGNDILSFEFDSKVLK